MARLPAARAAAGADRGLYLGPLRRRRPSGVRFSSLSLVRAALPPSSRLRRHLPFALFAVALAAPARGPRPTGRDRERATGQTTIILAIDVSRSMCSTESRPTGCEAAEAAAAAFIQRQAGDADRHRRLRRLRGDDAGADDRPEVAAGRARCPAWPPAGGRRSAAGSSALDAIAEIDPLGGSRRADSNAPGVPRARAQKGAYAPDMSSCSPTAQATAGARPSMRPAGGGSRRARLHDRLRDRRPVGALNAHLSPQLWVEGRLEARGFGGGGPPGGPGGFGAGSTKDTLQAGRHGDREGHSTRQERRAAQGRVRGLPTIVITEA